MPVPRCCRALCTWAHNPFHIGSVRKAVYSTVVKTICHSLFHALTCLSLPIFSIHSIRKWRISSRTKYSQYTHWVSYRHSHRGSTPFTHNSTYGDILSNPLTPFYFTSTSIFQMLFLYLPISCGPHMIHHNENISQRESIICPIWSQK